jgi:hypothetical protein
MLNLLAFLAQTAQPDIKPPGPGVFLLCIIFGLLIQGILLWGVFTKAGHPGWASMVPIYSAVILCQIGGKPWWWIILFIVPLVGFIMWIILCIAIAERFGKGTGFAIGLALLSVIFFPILGYGSATYSGPPAAAR